jgi:hypothetical protein
MLCEVKARAMKIVFEDGVCEDIDAELVDGKHHRLLATPLCSSSGAKLGDVVELTSEGKIWRFERVVDRSPLEMLDCLVPRVIAEARELQDLFEYVRQIGGEWEQAFGGIVFLHVPQTSVPDVQSRMMRILQQYE